MGIGGKSVDLGIAFVKRPVLAPEFEQEGLYLAKRPAFNGCANLGAKLHRPGLATSQKPRNKTTVVLSSKSLPQAVREDSTGELPQKTLGAVPCDELERGIGRKTF